MLTLYTYKYNQFQLHFVGQKKIFTSFSTLKLDKIGLLLVAYLITYHSNYSLYIICLTIYSYFFFFLFGDQIIRDNTYFEIHIQTYMIAILNVWGLKFGMYVKQEEKLKK
eukprot:TRINITY_DN8395_c0_g1_i14.p5 TRINITY_DN8395_c0_g1~~TRINITY_DN8395_c0_g1_i14.p5  ORF type:complete len:110 (+),score=1.66 TRINITY_DN8395_c0_g1_i14:278-607(+)